MPPWVAAALIALAAMIVRGLTGFGAALVMTPLLLLVFDAKTAIVSAALVQVVIGVALLYQVRARLDAAYLRLLAPWSVAGIAAGALLFVWVDPLLLKRLLGAVVVLFAARSLGALRGGGRMRTLWNPRWGYGAGLISGALGALLGTSGPPVVIFLENQLAHGATLRATLIAYFVIVDCVRTGGYLLGGQVSPDKMWIAAAMLPSAFLGSYVGTHLHLRMNERAFRASVGVLLMLTGLLLIVN